MSRRFSRIFCPHCQCKVSKSTYYSHYELYYDARSKKWQQDTVESTGETADKDFDFSACEPYEDKTSVDSDGSVELDVDTTDTESESCEVSNHLHVL